ncbi:hypothetical protein [Clavibacter michiganensis]|uniref:hypothetical protein n=1 Tax=Clavibacter michiganensis TaxID=28447 RepID=UPI00292CE66D|nr:hypothetical protein [Clavibacter michiganensis]
MATRHITPATCDVLPSADAVDLRHHDGYLRSAKPVVQHAIFTTLADSVLELVPAGRVIPDADVRALPQPQGSREDTAGVGGELHAAGQGDAAARRFDNRQCSKPLRIG